MERLSDEDLPCWYELSWSEKEPAIVLRVHNDFIENVPEIIANMPFLWGLENEIGFEIGLFDSFSGSLKSKDGFGFNKVFKYVGNRDGFNEFKIQIPEVRQMINMPCEKCGGTGKDIFFDDIKRECIYCCGKGIKIINQWKTAFEISASFTLFSKLSGYFETLENKTSSSLCQLLTVETDTKKEMHGGSMHGEVSPLLNKWLSVFDKRVIPEITKAMKVAYRKLYGPLLFDEHSFNVSIYTEKSLTVGGFSISCPGDACGLYVSSNVKENKGYQFSCHNVDNPIQQITLIGGLAALCGAARREMERQN